MKTMPAAEQRQPRPKAVPYANGFPISVKMFHEMIDAGILTTEDRCELIEGELKRKDTMNPPHRSAFNVLIRWLFRNLPEEWTADGQCPVTFSESEPQPDIAVVRADPLEYRDRHPGPADIGLLIEVADSSLEYDRLVKLPLYARVGVPCYWIVNLPERQIEVCTQPTATGKKAKYARRKVYKAGDEVPVILDGAEVARLKVNLLFK